MVDVVYFLKSLALKLPTVLFIQLKKHFPVVLIGRFSSSRYLFWEVQQILYSLATLSSARTCLRVYLYLLVFMQCHFRTERCTELNRVQILFSCYDYNCDLIVGIEHFVSYVTSCIVSVLTHAFCVDTHARKKAHTHTHILYIHLNHQLPESWCMPALNKCLDIHIDPDAYKAFIALGAVLPWRHICLTPVSLRAVSDLPLNPGSREQANYTVSANRQADALTK